MCTIAVNDTLDRKSKVTVSGIQIYNKSAEYTYDMLCTIKNENPGCDIAMLFGSDYLRIDGKTQKPIMYGFSSLNPEWKEGDPPEQRLQH
jgi:hypothetical protein